MRRGTGEESALLTRRNRRLQSWNGAASGAVSARVRGIVAGQTGRDGGDRLTATAAHPFARLTSQPSDHHQEAPPVVPHPRQRRKSVAGTIETSASSRPGQSRRNSDASRAAAAAAASAAAQQRASTPSTAAATASAQSSTHNRASTASTPRHRTGNPSNRILGDMTPRGGGTPRNTPTPAAPQVGALRAPQRQEQRNVSWASSRDAGMGTPRRNSRRMQTVAAAAVAVLPGRAFRPDFDTSIPNGFDSFASQSDGRRDSACRSAHLAPSRPERLHRATTSPSRSPSPRPSSRSPSPRMRDESPQPVPPWVNKDKAQELTAQVGERALAQSRGLRPPSTNSKVAKKDRLVQQPPDGREQDELAALTPIDKTRLFSW